mgnify:FL=1
MEDNYTEKAIELINAIKNNILKPMYEGLNKNTDDAKSEIIARLSYIEGDISEIKQKQDAFIEAVKNIKWDI